MKCGDSTFIGDLQAGKGQIAPCICQPWILLQCTCRSAGLCWHSNAPYFSEMPDFLNYCTCSTSLPGICKIALNCPSAAFSPHTADVPGYSGQGRSPQFLRQASFICTVLCAQLSSPSYRKTCDSSWEIKKVSPTKEMH